MGINWILLFQAYKYTTVSAATLSYYFAPVIVTIVCPILFHEKLTKKQIICFIMSTLGLVMITGIGNIGGRSDFIGILFGLGAAVFYATVILLNKFIKNVEGIHRTFLQFLSAIIILTPYVISTSGITLGNLNSIGWVNLLIVGLIHTGVTYCMYFSSLKELPGQKAAILSYIDPLVAVIISVTILGETMTLWQIIGGILILGFTLWNEITPKEYFR
ncbi:DMT family transporter [uncultured Clostridium sp.]|uniref:DMT family transporter n=1 Tax=uncultured Clostridium sp. TaxID=59620 RepID=UPI0034148A34